MPDTTANEGETSGLILGLLGYFVRKPRISSGYGVPYESSVVKFQNDWGDLVNILALWVLTHWSLGDVVQLVLEIKFMGTSYEIVLRWMP